MSEDTTTEQELLGVLGSKKQGKKEDRPNYLQRLTKECKSKWWADEVSEKSDEEWETLSDPVQEWVNNAVTAADSGEEIAEFPDFEEADETNEEEESEMSVDADEDEAPRKKPAAPPAKAAKPAAKVVAKSNGKEPATKSVKASKEEKPAAAKKPKSAVQFIRDSVVKKPAIGTEELMEKLGKAGYSKISETTVSVMRSDIRNTLKTLVAYDIRVEDLRFE